MYSWDCNLVLLSNNWFHLTCTIIISKSKSKFWVCFPFSEKYIFLSSIIHFILFYKVSNTKGLLWFLVLNSPRSRGQPCTLALLPPVLGLWACTSILDSAVPFQWTVDTHFQTAEIVTFLLTFNYSRNYFLNWTI